MYAAGLARAAFTSVSNSCSALARTDAGVSAVGFSLAESVLGFVFIDFDLRRNGCQEANDTGNEGN